MLRRSEAFRRDVGVFSKARGILPESVPNPRPCGPMCQTHADNSCKSIHKKIVSEVFRIARSDKAAVRSLDVVLGLKVQRGDRILHTCVLVTAYFEPKTANIAESSIIVTELKGEELVDRVAL